MNALRTNLTKRRRGAIAYGLATFSLAIGLLLLWWPTPSQAQATLGVKQTVGTAANRCASTVAIAVATNTTIQFCVTLTNPTNVVLTQHTLRLIVPELALTRALTFTTNLPPGQSVAVNTSYLAGIGQSVSPSPLAATASTSFTSTVTATSTNREGDTASGTAAVRVVIGAVGLQLKKTVGTLGNQCGTTRGLAVNQNTTVYYCVTITKSGDLPLVQHRLVDDALGVDITFTDPITNTTPRIYTAERVRALQPPTELKKIITQNFTNTVTLTSYTAEGVEVTAQAAAHAIVGRAAISVTDTVGGSATGCATTNTFAVAANATVYHCLRITNRGTVPLTRHQLTIPLLGLNSAVTQTIRTGEVLTLTSTTLPQLKRVVAAAETSNVTVQSTNANGILAQATTTAQVSLGTATLTVVKYPQRDPNSCARTTALNILSNEPFYYCLVVRNNGQLPLVTHSYSEPNIGLSGRFSYTLAAGQYLTLTNQVLANSLKVNANLGPFRITGGINNQLTYTARTATNTVSTATSNGTLTIVPPTSTATTAPTIAPTLSPTPTPSPTISPTPIPTPTPTTVVLSFPATPTSAFNLNSIETPTPGVAGAQNPPFNSPVETPFFPTPDYVATTFALTAEAAATQTSIAFFPLPTSPLPLPFETPTPPLPPLPTPEATIAVESPTPTPLVAIVAPTALTGPSPTPAPIADYLNVVAGMLAVSTATLGWIWFLVGSIIFFAVAGIFAGLTFRQQERHRYETATEEEPLPLLDEPALAGSSSLYYMTEETGDGYTVATSRPVTPAASDNLRYARNNNPANNQPGNDRNNQRDNQSNQQERNRPATDDLESDDFWPASLR